CAPRARPAAAGGWGGVSPRRPARRPGTRRHSISRHSFSVAGTDRTSTAQMAQMAAASLAEGTAQAWGDHLADSHFRRYREGWIVPSPCERRGYAMSRALMLWVAGAVLAFPLVPGQAVPLPIHKGRRHGPPPRPLATGPVGKWNVK